MIKLPSQRNTLVSPTRLRAGQVQDCLALTEFEALGLRSQLNFADGHSYVNPKDFFPSIVEDLSNIWNHALKTPIPEMEQEFKERFASFYHLRSLAGLERFSICPTASNSIDIAGAYLATIGYRVGLIEPTFDNLALLLKRRNVPVQAISEFDFFDFETLKTIVERYELQSLFIVNPNNPTGTVWTRNQLETLAEFALSKDLLLIFDSSFRFARRDPFDDYEVLEGSGVRYIAIEDTGKLWPAMDTKASLLTASRRCWGLLRQIYDEVYLCSSNLSLALIVEFIRCTEEQGGLSFVQKYVQQRRQISTELESRDS